VSAAKRSPDTKALSLLLSADRLAAPHIGSVSDGREFEPIAAEFGITENGFSPECMFRKFEYYVISVEAAP
jgi:hypothetical protein